MMNKSMEYEVQNFEHGVHVKSWTRGVPFEEGAKKQLRHLAGLPFIHHHIAVMPDVHQGKGSTIGSVIPTQGALIPAAVGVDLGCGMMAVRTTLKADQLPDSLAAVRSQIERAVPHGRSINRAKRDSGAWSQPPKTVQDRWKQMTKGFERIVEKHPVIAKSNNFHHLGTLGTGNHFIEICEDQVGEIWVMLHSGSRGVGNRIGRYFIERAKKDMERWFIQLPDKDLAYIPEGSDLFDDYVASVSWAQDFARENRELMMQHTLHALSESLGMPFSCDEQAVNCHHNYVAQEHHFGQNVWVTRKGAVRARSGDLGIIPGSMGARSYIVEGKGNADSFCSCSHGAGRVMSRTEAKRRFNLEDHIAATQGVECRKDREVIDETPAAYKPIEAVMAAQSDLVSIKHTLKQLVCVKG